MAEKNGNGWIRWALGIITLILSTTIGYVIANDGYSRERDISETEKREIVSKEVVRIDTNQKNVMTKLDEVAKKVDNIVNTQTSMIGNQANILGTLNELKQEIRKIQ